jgi:hypothetical protein
MEITRNNYEQYFLDYHEENLDPVRVGELMLFLEQNPDLKEEFETFRMIILEDDFHAELPEKGSLKKDVINPGNADHFYAAYVEGDLTEQQILETEAFVMADKSRLRELELMKKTRLSADLSVKYPNKSSLKRHIITPVYRRIWQVASAAAVITLLFGLFLNLPKIEEDNQLIVVSPQPIHSADPEPIIVPQPEIISKLPVHAKPSPAPARPATQPSGQLHAAEPLQVERLNRQLASLPAITSVKAPLEKKDEFAYWSHRMLQDDYLETDDIQPEQPPQRSFVSFARNRLRDNIPEEIREFDRSRLTLWEIAGRGLAGISNLAGIPLNVEQERDANGGLIQLAVGDSFEIRKRER